MRKVVVNRCFGGFGLSKLAFEWLIAHKGWKVTSVKDDEYEDETAQLIPSAGILEKDSYYMIDCDNDVKTRTNPDIIACIEAIGGDKASGFCAELEVVEVPDGVAWHIHEYDGYEHVAENHRTWP